MVEVEGVHGLPDSARRAYLPWLAFGFTEINV